MTDLPVLSEIVGGTTTEAQFQSAMTDLYGVLSEVIGVQPPEELEIEDGVVTPSTGFIHIDTENTSASDNLSNIESSNIGEKLLLVQSTSAARVITLKHNEAGSGKLNLLDSADTTLSDPKQLILFRFDSGDDTWHELFRNFSLFAPTAALKEAARTALGIEDIATKSIGITTGKVPTADLLGALAFLSTISNSQIQENTIAGSKLLPDIITLAKIAGYPAGSLLYWDSSGNPQVLPPGVDGEVLLTGGSSGPPRWDEFSKELTFSAGENVWYSDTSGHSQGSGYAKAYGVQISRKGTVRVEAAHYASGDTGGFRRSYVRLLKNGSVIESGVSSTTSGQVTIHNWDVSVNSGDILELQNSNGLSVSAYITSVTTSFAIKAAEPLDQIVAV